MVEKPEYTTWTLETSQFQYSDSSPTLETYPNYTFEYPSCFMEFVPMKPARAPKNIYIVRRFSWENDHEERKDDETFTQEMMDEILEWYQPIFEVYINSDKSYQPFERAPLEFPNQSENESSQVIAASQILIDGITAERTIKRYYTEAVLYGADYWRIFGRTVFEYNEYTCYIVMDCPEDKVDIMTKYYDHMLETFHFLD